MGRSRDLGYVPFFLNAVVVRAPVGDAFLDGGWLQALGEGLVDQGWELLVGGEA